MRVRAGTRPIQRWGGNRRVDVPVMWPSGSEQGPGQSNGGEGVDEQRAAEVLEQKPPKIDKCRQRLFDATEKRWLWLWLWWSFLLSSATMVVLASRCPLGPLHRAHLGRSGRSVVLPSCRFHPAQSPRISRTMLINQDAKTIA